MERLEYFLKRHGVFDRFKANAEQEFGDYNSYVRIAIKKPEREQLACAFNWELSLEGFKYWSDLDDKWNNDDLPLGTVYKFPQYDKTAVLSSFVCRGDKMYLSEILCDSKLSKTAVVDEIVHGKDCVEVYLR